MDLKMKTMAVNKVNEEQENGKKRFSTRKLRFWAQVFASAITIWIGVEFVRFVHYLESGGIGSPVERPPGVEAFLPISGLISFRDWIMSGVVNNIHPSAMIIVLVAIGVGFLFKKGFCSWVCPVGLISEMIGNIGDSVIGLWIKDRRLKLPRWLDYPFRSLKYLLMGFFLWAVFYSMSPDAIREFISSPYNKVADIKMLKFFTEIDSFALWTIIILFALSIFLRGFWCRYLCPYGALLGLFSLLGPGRIRRDANYCTECGTCTKVCPSFIKVDKLKTVISDECTGCLDCVDSCPAKGALELKTIGSRKVIPKKAWAFAMILTFWGALALFMLTGPWQNSISQEEYIYHIERMDGPEYYHPGR
jgi:ferredoxin